MFPFNIVGVETLGENTIFLNILFVLPAMGFVFYYRKRQEYSANIKKIVKISVIIIPLIFVGAVFIGIAMGINSVFFPPSYENTKEINTELLEKKVLDWVNTNRYKNKVGGINLDDSLNSLAEIRSEEISQALPEEMESIANVDVNNIAKREGIRCMIDGNSVPIYDYVLQTPHNIYPDIEKLTNFLMTSLASNEEQNEIVFAPNVTKTGIVSFVTEDYLIVIQNFC